MPTVRRTMKVLRSLKIRLESENILKKSIDTENSLIHNKHSVSDDLKHPAL